MSELIFKEKNWNNRKNTTHRRFELQMFLIQHTSLLPRVIYNDTTELVKKCATSSQPKTQADLPSKA